MKSKQSIRILIVLMSLALIGVIVIQFLWISSAVILKQEQFDRSVKMAMIRVSADLESKYGVHLITEKLEKDSAARKQVMKQDPGFYKFMININDKQGEAQEEVVWEQNSVRVSGEEAMDANINVRSVHRSRQVIAMVNVSGNGEQEIATINVLGNEAETEPVVAEASFMLPAGPVAPPAPPAAPGGPGSKSNLMNIVQCVADEYAMSKMDAKDIYDVIDSAKIRASISKEFKEAGLPQDFEFATYCTQGDTLMINKSASETPLLDFSYKSPLLATDFIEASSLLLVNFPARLSYIFSSLASMLLLSICFTCIIVIAFAYSLHLIFKQKKVSEITNDFINNMTHELKTPLATISMTADTLLLSGVSAQPDRVNEYSGMIKKEVKKLSRHVDRILEAAVTESNGSEPQGFERIGLNELVQEEARLFEPQIVQHGGKIQVQVSAEEVFVRAGKDMLRSVICNLLDNALKYSETAPEIKISVQKKHGSALLCVTDSGIGISKVDQKHVFEKFYRAHTGNRHDVKGFGLGLSFAKGVIEGAGGKIWVESSPAGSSFFVELPTT